MTVDYITDLILRGDSYKREDSMKLNPVCLRSLFRERIYHTIEVEIYPILLGRKKMQPTIGLQTELILDVWKDRGFHNDDFQWSKTYMELVVKI